MTDIGIYWSIQIIVQLALHFAILICWIMYKFGLM